MCLMRGSRAESWLAASQPPLRRACYAGSCTWHGENNLPLVPNEPRARVYAKYGAEQIQWWNERRIRERRTSPPGCGVSQNRQDCQNRARRGSRGGGLCRVLSASTRISLVVPRPGVIG